MALCTMPACVLDPGNLEAGGDGDGGELLECARGTNPDGSTDPLFRSLRSLRSLDSASESFRDDCYYECDEGWGHGAELLESDWTWPGETGRAHALLPLPDGRAVVVVETLGNNWELHTFSADGPLLSEAAVIATPGHTLLPSEWTVDEAGTIYAVSRDATGREVVESFTPEGQQLWSYAPDSDPQPATVHISGVDDGVTRLLRHEGGPDQLSAIDGSGEQIWNHEVGEVSDVLVSSSSSAHVLHNPESGEFLRYTYLGEGELFGFQPVPVPAATEVADVELLGATGMIAVGTALESEPSAHTQGWLYLVPEAPDGSSFRYRRGQTSCSIDPYKRPSAERLLDVALLADQSMIIVGTENSTSAGEVLPPATPWVGHVASDGTFLAFDRGYWFGEAIAAIATPDGGAMVLIRTDSGSASWGYNLRKYGPF